MALIDVYPALRHTHIACVVASGTFFTLRAAGVIAGARWPLTLPARVTSWVVDTLLLVMGALLWTALRIDPLSQPWLPTKLALLVVYVGLGTMALRRARGTAAKLGWTLAALACFGWMVGVAIAHHPLGPWQLLAAMR